ncbi:hypothetical protein ABZ897_46575 [Nonomuraea sp. NPDC046802]
MSVVTNGMPDNQLGKLRRTGLADVIDDWARPHGRYDEQLELGFCNGL